MYICNVLKCYKWFVYVMNILLRASRTLTFSATDVVVR